MLNIWKDLLLIFKSENKTPKNEWDNFRKLSYLKIVIDHQAR